MPDFIFEMFLIFGDELYRKSRTYKYAIPRPAYRWGSGGEGVG